MARPIGESAQAGIGMLTGVLVVALVMFASHLLAKRDPEGQALGLCWTLELHGGESDGMLNCPATV